MKLTEIKSISDLLKNDKAVKIIVVIGLAVIVMILFFDLFKFGSTAGNSENRNIDAEKYILNLEERVTCIVSEINGTGRVKVMITLENLDENVYSQKETSLTTVRAPKVRGAAVVCDGGGDILVKEKIVETVSKVLGISTARVSVTN